MTTDRGVLGEGTHITFSPLSLCTVHPLYLQFPHHFRFRMSILHTRQPALGFRTPWPIRSQATTSWALLIGQVSENRVNMESHPPFTSQYLHPGILATLWEASYWPNQPFFFTFHWLAGATPARFLLAVERLAMCCCHSHSRFSSPRGLSLAAIPPAANH